jgi:hypothetical protein
MHIDPVGFRFRLTNEWTIGLPYPDSLKSQHYSFHYQSSPPTHISKEYVLLVQNNLSLSKVEECDNIALEQPKVDHRWILVFMPHSSSQDPSHTQNWQITTIPSWFLHIDPIGFRFRPTNEGILSLPYPDSLKSQQYSFHYQSSLPTHIGKEYLLLVERCEVNDNDYEEHVKW